MRSAIRQHSAVRLKLFATFWHGLYTGNMMQLDESNRKQVHLQRTFDSSAWCPLSMRDLPVDTRQGLNKGQGIRV